MSETVREMTMEELIAENRDLRAMAREMQSHIDCLKAELDEVQQNRVYLPTEPIKVADMLINEKIKHTRDTLNIARKIGAKEYYRFNTSQLRQIAEHLLVYCNNSEE